MQIRFWGDAGRRLFTTSDGLVSSQAIVYSNGYSKQICANKNLIQLCRR